MYSYRQNILLTRDGQIKIADFGLAKNTSHRKLTVSVNSLDDIDCLLNSDLVSLWNPRIYGSGDSNGQVFGVGIYSEGGLV